MNVATLPRSAGRLPGLARPLRPFPTPPSALASALPSAADPTGPGAPALTLKEPGASPLDAAGPAAPPPYPAKGRTASKNRGAVMAMLGLSCLAAAGVGAGVAGYCLYAASGFTFVPALHAMVGGMATAVTAGWGAVAVGAWAAMRSEASAGSGAPVSRPPSTPQGS
ncbi:MAG TPA: hypothetical protein VNO81_03040 [Candidatus Nitrosotenuis sp.]|nr:hypothetical protein [Candidatus Nitrosotenuis sp.]